MQLSSMIILFCLLMSVWLLKMIFMQQKLISELTNQNQTLIASSAKLTDQIAAEKLYHTNMDMQVTNGINVAQDLEKKIPELVSKNEKTVTEVAACQEALKTMKSGLDSLQKDINNNKALMKPQPDLWKKEILTLQTQLKARSPICDHVKNVTIAAQLCGKSTKP